MGISNAEQNSIGTGGEKNGRIQRETNVPAHLSAERGYSAPVLELWRGQHPTPDLHHVVAYGQTKFLNIGVIVEVCTSNQIVYFTFPVGSRPAQQLMKI